MSSPNTCTVGETGSNWAAARAIFCTLLLVGLPGTRAWAFSTDQAFLTRRFDVTSATTNIPITVTAVLTNGGTSAVRGFYFTEQIPSGLALRTLGVVVDGRTVSNYALESGIAGEVYAGYTTYRWILETPTAFSANNSIAPNTVAHIQYSLTSPLAGTFSLAQFSWCGFYPSTATPSFGYSDITDAQTINFTVGSSPTYPILALSATSMTFNATTGSSPPSQSLGISNIGGEILNWTAVADGSAPAWLTVSTASGSGNATLTVAVDSASLGLGSYSKAITVSAAGAGNSPQTVMVNLNVDSVASIGTGHYDFAYRDRASLLAAGWDFLARTASGATRNTEQTSGAVVSYDQASHPGVLRVPDDLGDLWFSLNNTRNSLFRPIPTNWLSLKLKLSFAPTQNAQQAGLAVYQDDDNYVFVDRIYNDGSKIACSAEVHGQAIIVGAASVAATNDLVLRLDLQGTNVISAWYSLDGTNWVSLGSASQALSNPRLGIIVGGSPGGYLNADLTWVEVTSTSTVWLPTSPIELKAPAVVSGNFGFDLPTEAGIHYVVEYKDRLTDPGWNALTNLSGSGSVFRVVDPAPLSPARLYRVRVP